MTIVPGQMGAGNAFDAPAGRDDRSTPMSSSSPVAATSLAGSLKVLLQFFWKNRLPVR